MAELWELNMGHEQVVRDYLRAMEAGDLVATFACFHLDATVTSPVYGDMPVKPFYERLYGDTVTACVDIRNIYAAVGSPDHWAAHFGYRWTRRDGASLSSNLVDLFQFRPGTELIDHLEIIFDRGAMVS